MLARRATAASARTQGMRVVLEVDRALVVPADEVEWFRAARLTRHGPVRASVPGGFAAYARLLHPARSQGRPVRWADIAAWNGQRLHPTVTDAEVMQRADGVCWTDLPGNEAPAGTTDGLDELGAQRLHELLGAATTTPDRRPPGGDAGAPRRCLRRPWSRWRGQLTGVGTGKPCSGRSAPYSSASRRAVAASTCIPRRPGG
jgi:hypothetical protein